MFKIFGGFMLFILFCLLFFYFSEDILGLIMKINKSKGGNERKPSLATKKIVLLCLLLIIAIITLITSFYTVDQTEYAILTTFKRPSSEIIQPGLRFNTLKQNSPTS